MDYVIYKSGLNFVAQAVDGTILAQDTDFAAMMNSLNAIIAEGKTIQFRNFVFPVNAIAAWRKSNTYFIGESLSAILRANPAMTTYLMEIYSGHGGNTPHDVTFDGITVDGNFGPNITPLFAVGGQYNVVKNGAFLNAIQYGLHFWRAHDSKFLSNYINKAEYGLSTGADETEMNTNIEMAYNIIRDSQDVGIKLRWINVALIHDNDIDCAYLTWTTNASGSTLEGAAGIRYYQGDGPTIDCVVNHNNIYDSDKSRITVGVGIDEDAAGWADRTTIRSSGQVIINNSITDLYYGILSKFPNVKIGVDAAGNLGPNIIQRSRYAAVSLWPGADGCIAKGNDIYGGIVDTFGVDVQANNCQITANRIRGVAKGWGGPIRNLGTGNTFLGNLYDIPIVTSSQTTTPITTRKITTSSTPVSSPLIVQGFELGVGETFYTEQGSTLVVGAKAIAGYGISSFIVNGVSVAPNANGLIALTIEAQDYTVQAVYVATPPPPSHILVVTTVPIVSVPIVLNGQNYFTPTSPITLPEGSHSVSCPSNVIIGSDTYNFSQWEDGSTNPQRMFPLTADATIMATYVLVQPPPAKGSIEVHAFLESTEIVAGGVVVETGQTFQTPTTIIVDPGTYVVRVTNGTQVKEQWAVVTQDQMIRLDFQFQPPAPISPLSKVLPVLAPILIGGVSLSLKRRG
jgi:hypothetical protein